MRIVLDQDQAKLFADKLMDLGNLSIVGLVIDRFLISADLNLVVPLMGIMTFLGTYIMAYYLLKGGVRWT